MADKPFDRTMIRFRERPVSSDHNQAQSQADRTTRFMMKQLFSRGLATGLPAIGTASSGFVGSGFWVRPKSPAAMQVSVLAGVGFIDRPSDLVSSIDGVTSVDDLESYKPLVLLTDQTLTVPAADPANPRIDIIEVRVDRRAENNLSRDVFNSGASSFLPTLVNKSVSFVLDGLTSVNGSSPINYKTGTPAGVPAAPATSSGYVKIGEVLVGAAVASIAENKITDLRSLLAPYGIHHVAVTGMVNATTPFTPTIASITAPPGMQVAVVGTGGNGGNLYIICGAAPLSLMATPHVEASSTTINVYSATPNFGTISSGEQTELAGAGAAPVLNVAIGQPRIKIQYGGFRFFNGTQLVAAIPSGDGNQNYKAAVQFLAGQMVVAP